MYGFFKSLLWVYVGSMCFVLCAGNLPDVTVNYQSAMSHIGIACVLDTIVSLYYVYKKGGNKNGK